MTWGDRWEEEDEEEKQDRLGRPIVVSLRAALFT